MGKRPLRIMMAVLGGLGLALPSGLPAAAASVPTAQAITWGACAAPPDGIPDGGQQCGTLSVPRDYQQPDGPHITVAVSRIRAADPAKRRGVLLVNPGGPGGSGLDLPRVLTILMPQSVLDAYDLIGFDPRGVGASTPVTCGLTPQEATQAMVPLMQNGSFSDTVAFNKKVAQRCGQQSGGLLPYITTANTARDMDQIRRALGEPKINYFAYSYGTELGAVYASLFANHTDRFVLDSSVDPQWVWRQQFRSWGLGGETRFPDFAQYAADNNATYGLGATPEAVRQTYLQLIDQLRSQPQTLADGTVLNDAYFRELSFSGLYDDANFPIMASLWQDALRPMAAASTSLETLRNTLMGAPSDNAAASALAVLCDDAAWPRSARTYQRQLQTDVQRYPLFGELGSNYWACGSWPNRPQQPPVAISSQGPAHNILIMQDLRDPATPYQGALQMRAALGNRARMVSVDQGGHAVSYLKPNTCANNATTAWLADGTFPADDTLCPANLPGPQPLLEPQIVSPAHDRAAQVLRQMTSF